MSDLQRVVWSKGMFLTPQHFQAQDRAFEQVLQFRLGSSLFANWGVTSLRIDGPSLTNGQFSVTEARGVFPDGLPFDFSRTDQAPAGRMIAEFFEPDQEALDVFLAVPERRRGALFRDSNAASTTGSYRYSVDNVEVADESATSEEKTVQLARSNIQLLLGGQNRDGFVSFQIARVIRNQAGLYALDEEFIAPCLDVISSAHLMGLVRRQIEILATKSDSLNASRRQRGQNLADFNATETARFWLLHTVNTSLPELRHLWAVRRGHPEILYLSMLRLAGALSTFSFDAKARDLPDYNHENLGYCFKALDERIRNLMETVIPSKCTSIPLKLVDKSTWAGQISSDEQLRNTQFILAVGTVNNGLGVDDLIKRTLDKVKVSSSDEIQKLVSLALPGVTLRHQQTPPPAVPFKLDNQYFTLNQSGRLWERITQSRGISLFVPSDIPEPKLELLVISQ